MLSQSKRKVSLFTALCLFCAMVELVIPKPGFLRIGVSNVPVMIALFVGFSPLEYGILVLSRLLFQSLFNGSLLSYAFVLSLSAGLVSAFVMFFAYKIPGITFIGISELGAFASNIVQIYVSHFFLGKGVYSLAPIILGLGVVTSFILGLLTSLFCRNSQFIKDIQDPAFFAAYAPRMHDFMKKKTGQLRMLKLVLSIALLLFAYFSDNNIVPGFACLSFLIACIVTKRKIRVWPVMWVIIRTVLISLLMPNGKVLYSLGAFSITQNSILLGLRRSFILLSSCWFSRFVIPHKDELECAFNANSIAYMTLSYFKEITEKWFKTELKKPLSKHIDQTLCLALKADSNLT